MPQQYDLTVVPIKPTDYLVIKTHDEKFAFKVT